MSELLQVVAGPLKPSLTIRAWHRFQERVRAPSTRHRIANAIALFRPRTGVDTRPEDVTLERDGIALMPGYISTQQGNELRRLLEKQECIDPWKPTGGTFPYDAAPENTHVADIPAAPTIAELHGLALDPKLLRLASVYFGCRPYLDSIQAWWSLSGNEEPEEAENYHRDNDSIRFLKFFLYLTDVGEEHGPHKFVVGSHREGKLLERRRLTDAEVEVAFGPNRIQTMTGVVGDAFIEDTWGIHKGQLPRAGRRLLVQFRYSIMPTVFRSPLVVKPRTAYDTRCVTSLLYQR
jgi:hypothetical protein